MKDRLCFNGAVGRLNCTSQKDNGFEFFVITGLPPRDLYYTESLFSGVLGLSRNTSNNDVLSVIEYLQVTSQIDK